MNKSLTIYLIKKGIYRLWSHPYQVILDKEDVALLRDIGYRINASE